MGSIGNRSLQHYLQQLQRHPLRIKVITAGVLSGISDVVAQKITGIPKIQLRRLVLKAFFGACYGGPFGHYMYILLDKIFIGKKDAKSVAQKVVLEQLTLSPFNHLLFMIYYGMVIDGQPWFRVKAKIKKDYPSVQYTAWTFWPVVGLVNQLYVPQQFRVIFNSLIALGWGMFMNSISCVFILRVKPSDSSKHGSLSTCPSLTHSL